MKKVNLLPVVCGVFDIDGTKIYQFKGVQENISVEYQEVLYEFLVPTGIKEHNEIHVNGYNKETQIYYGIVYNLLLEADIGPIDVYYHTEGETVKDDRVLFYKYFETFEKKYNSNLNVIEEKILEYIDKEKSVIDGLFSFFEDYSDRYDIEDIKNNISKTLKQRIAAEAKQLNLINGNKVKQLL